MSRHVNSYDEGAPLPGVGSIWVWELDSPYARSLIEVVDVFWNGEEWWVRTKSLLPKIETLGTEEPIALNDVGRFWEAVTLVRQTKTPRPSLDPSTEEDR